VNITNTNVYNATVINSTTVNHISYNGGTGGITVRPTAQQEAVARERHIPPDPSKLPPVPVPAFAQTTILQVTSASMDIGVVGAYFY
jgi:hypothetical protein